jgi:ABC-type bacteriocin/lantibiotic exporter with double-glycine peptidase domain
MRRLAIAVALASGLAGSACATYSGGARTADPARLATEPGWIVAATTPALHQIGARDCGAATLAMVAGRWHVPLSLDAAVSALPAPTSAGVRLGDLRDAARSHGLSAFAISGDHDTLVHELSAGRPVIVGLLLPYGNKRVQSHYEVIVGVHPSDDTFMTIDPAVGWRSYRWSALDAEWKPAGRPTLVVLGPRSAAVATLQL